MRQVAIGAFWCAWVVATSAALAVAQNGREPLSAIPATPTVEPDRARLGERLFNDVQISRNFKHSCATCHPLDRGGMDGLPIAVKYDGTPHGRNTPTIFNASLNATQNWDGLTSTLEDHTRKIVPRLMNITWPELLARLRSDAGYVSAFAAAYEDGLTQGNVLNAVATYERTLLTPGSRFDRYLQGERNVLTIREREGYRLFRAYGCVSCHQGVNIGGNMYQRFGVFEAVPPRSGAPDQGRFLLTKVPRDKGVFRVPSLRNVGVTAPYFHDGRTPTLEAAVETMGRAQLGRALAAEDIRLIAEFLRTFTGEYRGEPLRPRREDR